jgi:ATP-dependent helicase/nuclease subunit B
VPLLDASDRFNAERLRGRLQQLSEAEESQRPFGAALAEIREALADFRVWTQLSPADPPRLSRGGAVHLSDLRHAGVTGRRRVFVLGLDADRVAGPRVADPLLPDAVRQELPGLGTTTARRAEARWLVGRAIAGLTGRVTLSFSMQSDDGGEVGPAPILLEVARELGSNPRLDYKNFRQQLAAPACPVPGAPGHALDRRDVWLRTIGAGDTLLDATAAVRAHNPGLAAGLRAVESLDAALVTPYHGLIDAAAGRFDPTGKGAGPISASSLELLSKCPLSWFYSYVLEVRALDDPEYDPDLWLDPMARGSLLHAVFERFVKQYRGRQGDVQSEAASAVLSAICEALLLEQRAETPPPSETVFQSERAEILRAAKSFLAMERGQLGKAAASVWEEAELWISGKKAVVTLPDGSRFQLKGKIDRIDGLPNGARLIVDYKTGGLYDFRKNSKAGPLNGGRKLQPALYSAAYAAMSGSKVTRFEYRFPTAKGRNAIIAHHPAELALGREVVAGVITNLQHGAFLPTLDADDCKYCDHRDICRVRGGEERFEKIQSPRAEWAGRFGESSEFYRAMIARRTK